ncbi:MAG: SCO family protein [Chitinophagales bacterium]
MKFNKFVAMSIVLVIPLIFYAYFEFKKQNEGVRIKELPFLSLDSIPDFRMTDQKGETFERKDIEGKIAVVDFFFTTCPGICPKLTGQMQRLQKYIFEHPNLKADYQLISITVDPETDTVGRMQHYAKEENISYDYWKLLTGNKDSIYELATGFFKLPAIDLGTDTVPEPFVHSERMVLLDRKGFIRGYYDGTDSSTVNELMKDIVFLDINYEIEDGKARKKQADDAK